MLPAGGAVGRLPPAANYNATLNIDVKVFCDLALLGPCAARRARESRRYRRSTALEKSSSWQLHRGPGVQLSTASRQENVRFSTEFWRTRRFRDFILCALQNSVLNPGAWQARPHHCAPREIIFVEASWHSKPSPVFATIQSWRQPDSYRCSNSRVSSNS